MKFSFQSFDFAAADGERTVVRFESSATFGAYDSAVSWCEAQGLSVGHMQGPDPIGLMYGNYDIAKWRNLSKQQRAELAGTIDGDKRNGPVTVTLKPRSAA